MRILLFGNLKEIANTNELLLTDIADLYGLKEKLYDLYPIIKGKEFAIAVNQNIVHENILLNNADEIALLPPFSGG